MKKILEARDFIRKQTNFSSPLGIILGTGLGGLTEDMEIEHEVHYGDIPNFPISTVESHSGRLLFGRINGKSAIVMQGRFHYYEGYSLEEVVFPVRVLYLLGVRNLFISNAAGGLDPAQEVGDLMIITDHINLLPENPLRGQNFDDLGPRFPDMSAPYHRPFIDEAIKIGKRLDCKVHEGVYVSVPGPSLETPAEYKYLRIIGADAVGMSTVPEVIAGVHLGLKIFAISVITDLGVEGKIEPVTVEKVLKAAYGAEPFLTQLFEELMDSI